MILNVLCPYALFSAYRKYRWKLACMAKSAKLTETSIFYLLFYLFNYLFEVLIVQFNHFN